MGREGGEVEVASGLDLAERVVVDEAGGDGDRGFDEGRDGPEGMQGADGDRDGFSRFDVGRAGGPDRGGGRGDLGADDRSISCGRSRRGSTDRDDHDDGGDDHDDGDGKNLAQAPVVLLMGFVQDVGVVLELLSGLVQDARDLSGPGVELTQRMVGGASAAAGPVLMCASKDRVRLGLGGGELVGAGPQGSGHLPGRRGIPSRRLGQLEGLLRRELSNGRGNHRHSVSRRGRLGTGIPGDEGMAEPWQRSRQRLGSCPQNRVEAEATSVSGGPPSRSRP